MLNSGNSLSDAMRCSLSAAALVYVAAALPRGAGPLAAAAETTSASQEREPGTRTPADAARAGHGPRPSAAAAASARGTADAAESHSARPSFDALLAVIGIMTAPAGATAAARRDAVREPRARFCPS